MVSLVKEVNYIADYLGAPKNEVRIALAGLLKSMVYCRGTVSSYNIDMNRRIKQAFNIYKDTLFKPHIDNSRNLIMHAAAQFPSGKTVVVLGPGLIEPLQKLLLNCGKLILIDNDPLSLAFIAKQLDSPKVETRTMDLSGGFCEAGEAFMEKMQKKESHEKGSSRKNFYLELFQVYNAFRPESCPIDIQADYVISSLVSSQLSVMVTRLISSFAEKDLRIGMGKIYEMDERNSVTHEKLGLQLLHLMLERHINDLQSMTKPNGKIYFSDTVTKTEVYPKTDVLSEQRVIPEAFFDALENHFVISLKREWLWFNNPHLDNGDGFRVHAYVMSLKERTTFAVSGWKPVNYTFDIKE